MTWESPSDAPRSAAGRRIPAIALIVAGFFLLAVLYSVVNPLFEAPDEIQHFFYVVHLAEGHGLPRLDSGEAIGPWAQEGSQPPLYYALAAPVIAPVDVSNADALMWFNDRANIGNPLSPGNKNRIIHTDAEAFPYRDAALAAHLARLISVIMGCATVYLVYLAARALLPDAPALALAAAALTAFTPQFIFISSSISNDNLITLLSTLAAWLLIRGLRGPGLRVWALWLGLSLGFAALAKLSGLALWPLAGATLLIVRGSRGEWRRAVREGLVIFGVAALVCGWWYVRNWLLYRDPTGLSAMLAVVGTRPEPLTSAALLRQFEGLRISYWGIFGWFSVLFPDWVYMALDIFTLVAALGLVVWGVTSLFTLPASREEAAPGMTVRPQDRGWLWLPVAWIAVMLVSLIRWTMITPGTQGRLLFPAAWAINLLLVLGWSRWTVLARLPQAGRGWLAAPVILLAALAVITPFAVIRPAYAGPPIVTAAQMPESARIEAKNHGGILRVLGSEIGAESVRPGDFLPVTVYWEVFEPTERDLTAFVHLLGRDAAPVGQVDTYLGYGAYPLKLLKAGDVVPDTYQVPVAYTATVPSLVRVDVGLFDPSDPLAPGLDAIDASGATVDGIVGTTRLLPARPPTYDISRPVSFDLGGQAELVGYDLPPAVARPGDIITPVLYWQAKQRMAEDYQVFVHLVGADGRPAAQGDKAPLDGHWPTSAWEPGYIVKDAYPIELPSDLASGEYELRAGLYRLADETRLPVAGPAGRTADSAVILERITVP